MGCGNTKQAEPAAGRAPLAVAIREAAPPSLVTAGDRQVRGGKTAFSSFLRSAPGPGLRRAERLYTALWAREKGG